MDQMETLHGGHTLCNSLLSALVHVLNFFSEKLTGGTGVQASWCLGLTCSMLSLEL